ncbi:PQQ-binding-like beta-propeller repeat protein [Halolamina sp. R1-12]|nr:PQQ-binding-like beta-propeller repeat protein [Halolamina sp. R1-12]
MEGAEQWTVDLPGEVRRSAAIADDRVVVRALKSMDRIGLPNRRCKNVPTGPHVCSFPARNRIVPDVCVPEGHIQLPINVGYRLRQNT